ncbi:MAG TPA: response regulator [Conexibacter sp.]|jgi:two-component system chemotaxis sensor kinase CheA|nr:response regulator [Conexibacter sp.]
MSDARGRLLEIFREEAAERLDRVVATLLAIDAGDPPDDATDALFRDVHSLKGGAGLVGLEPVREVAHAAEELLSGVRSAGQPVSRELVAPLLAVADAMRRGVAGEEIVPEEAIAALSAAAPARPVAAAGSGAAEPPPDDAAPADRPPPTDPAPSNGAPALPRARIDGSIRVSTAKVDRVLDAAGSATLHQRSLGHLVGATADELVGEALDRGAVLLDELQDAAIELRALPLSAITAPLPRYVRDLAASEDKEVELSLTGVETQLDRMVLDGLSDMLGHLLRNAIAHGIELPAERRAAGKPARGRVELRAEQRGGRVAIEVSDDGRGVAAELLQAAPSGPALADRLAQPGFSTAGSVDAVSGRGVGLDAVKAHVESIGGGLAVESEPGRGTTITLDLPLTLAVLHVLLVERLGQAFGVPVPRVEEVVAVDETTSLGGRPSIVLRGEAIPLGDLAAALGGVGGELPERAPALILCHGGTTVALACDRLLGEQSVVVKSLGPLLGRRRQYLGGAILSDGRVALIVDPAVAVAGAGALTATPAIERIESASVEAAAAPKVLVVDDQFTVRELQRSILEAAGYRVETAGDGVAALQQLGGAADIDLVVTDLEMPEMGGLELLRRVRGEPATASLPVVVVTSLAGEEDQRRGLEAGADAYVTKDRFDQRALLDTVERLIGR